MTSSTELPKIIIWRFIDGKVGHEKQSQAFIDGLEKYYSIESTDIHVKHTSIYYFFAWLLNIKLALYPKKSSPQLVIGAGHKTHLPLLAAKRYHRCKSLIIMSPSLPHWLFDVVVAPWHDHMDSPCPKNVVITPMALAPEIESKPVAEQGLILLGGESPHYHWDSQQIAEQIKHIVNSYPQDIIWQVSTSRRTPNDTIDIIQKNCRNEPRLNLLRHQDLEKNWLSLTLKTAGNIWITPDSPSMISEALMTRATVGLLTLKEKLQNGKIIRSNSYLEEKGLLIRSNGINAKKKNARIEKINMKKILQILEL